MASVTSLGIHKPSALLHLIEEGILPSDATEELFSWNTFYADDGEENGVDEEIITTKTCVVWSRGSVVQRIFRFEVEDQRVTQAIFTCFPRQEDERNFDAKDGPDRSTPRKGGGEADVELNIRKRRSSTPKLRRRDIERNSSASDGQRNQLADAKVTSSRADSTGRALVVIFKTQAHVFFLSGTSYIVHLPFEVEIAYPMSCGMLLQRKKSTSSSNLQFPSAPPVPSNSYAFSQVSSSGLFSTHIESNEPSTFRQLGSPLLPFIGDLSNQSLDLIDARLPKLFTLTDPLAEIGIVVAETGPPNSSDADDTDLSLSTLNIVDEMESLLYVSTGDELSHCHLQTGATVPFLLAVTRNDAMEKYTIWKIAYNKVGSLSESQKRPASSSSRRISHRRSSVGPNIRTGATTPITRGRESLGIGKSRTQSFKESAADNGSKTTEDDLVSQLDPAFENPKAPAKSSRRVSSLLARADLLTSHDKSTFSDLASSYNIPNGGRRGTSYASHGPGLSFNKDSANCHPSLGQFKSTEFGIEKTTKHEPSPNGELNNDDYINGPVYFGKSGPYDSVRGLHKGVIFTRVHDISTTSVGSRQSSEHLRESNKCRVFTLKAPEYALRKDPDNIVLALCIFEYSKQLLSILPIKFQTDLKKDVDDLNQENLDEFNKKVQSQKISFGKVIRYHDIVDACRIKDGDCFRILAISENINGLNELSLRAPWSAIFKLQLPANLTLYNPYQTNGHAPHQRREGGFRRILSEGPRVFAALRNEGSRGRVDIVDEAGRRHRIQIQMRPQSPCIRRILKVCESVIPTINHERERILMDWWAVNSWLRPRLDERAELEWTTMVVVLFSIAARLTEDRRSETTTRPKKRKNGLLRSSSGAITDLESWETMWNEESNSSNLPPWAEDVAWGWTLSQNGAFPMLHSTTSGRPKSSNMMKQPITPTVPVQKKSTYMVYCLSLSRDFLKSSNGIVTENQFEYIPLTLSKDPKILAPILATIVLSLHLLREEFKLHNLNAGITHKLTPIIAQIGGWLGWEAWGFNENSYFMLESADMHSWLFDDSVIRNYVVPPAPFSPSSILQFTERAHLEAKIAPFTSLLDIANLSITNPEDRILRAGQNEILSDLTPRTMAISRLLVSYSRNLIDPRASEPPWGIGLSSLETLPEGISVAFQAAISACRSRTLESLNGDSLMSIGKGEIGVPKFDTAHLKRLVRSPVATMNDVVGDVRSICSTTFKVEAIGAYDGSAEGDRQAITRTIFRDDQRFSEAVKLLHPLHPPIARCAPEPGWSDTELLEAQQELVKLIAIRTLAVSTGRGLLFYCARMPLLTEKFPIHGFTLSCIMKPANTTVTADRALYTEEKVSWAFFHAGVEAGLSISKDAPGINTSWILFNKPPELKNRHAGFLLALGLNGHLKSIANWAIVDYLNSKHTMTSIGFLLGLAASYLGTMDTQITRVLSIHVVRMLPLGAAELNHSPLSQTSGIMGVGLVYCNTQHRRMSEMMISEMENVDYADNSSPLDNLRDEGYRLAAGFALGYINLAQGKDLKGLHDMHLIERLLSLAVGTRKVDVVHILDKATAGATIAVALIYMKTQDGTVARKINVPDTVQQFDHVRPDIFLLRTVAHNLIMWNNIRANNGWMQKQLPSVYRSKLKLTMIQTLTTEDMPFFSILAGLCFSIGLRFAGTGSLEVRNLLCYYLDQFMRICRLPSLNYDGKLSRITVRNCQDAVALAVSCVMAGTGDIAIFRRLRALHGRTDPDTPYGSHLAAHLAIGVIFLGGGTYTFGTSNLAIASLLCAFYPLFPNSVLDNKSHLQAFRHLWVLAAEPRCLVTRDIDTSRPISLGVKATGHDGNEMILTAPCLLPEFETISKIQTHDPEYWPVTLDFANQTNTRTDTFSYHHVNVYVRRRAAYDADTSPFSAAMQSLNDTQSALCMRKQALEWILTLPVFGRFDRAEKALLLPPNAGSTLRSGTRGTVVDDRLTLETACITSGRSERLWNLRVLFTWAEVGRRSGERTWLGREVVEGLRAALEVIMKGEGRDKRR